MISPYDIQNKVFSRGVRGYKEDEVDDFLSLIVSELDKLINENYQLKDMVRNLNQEIDKHKKSENVILETLEAAKSLMGDISISAEKRADILLKNAELDAELIQREAKENAERLNEECQALRNRVESFANRYRNMLLSEIDKFENFKTELFEERIFNEIDTDIQSREATMPPRAKAKKADANAIRDFDETLTNFRTGDKY